MNFIPPQDETRLRAAASGVLPNGKPVIVNSDGTVSFVEGSTITQAQGSVVTFESGDNDGLSATYDSNSNRVVVSYKDVANSGKGTAAVGTVSGNSISFGTPVVYQTTTAKSMKLTFDSANNKVIMYFSDIDNSNIVSARVGTVSGSSISFGTKAALTGNPTMADDNISISCCFDSNAGKSVVFFKRANDSDKGTACVGTVSGTDITFGSLATFETGSFTYISSGFDSTSNKVMAVYNDTGNSSRGTIAIGTVSGTSVSFGTPVVFETGGSCQFPTVAHDSANNKNVIAFKDDSNSGFATAIVGTTSGTTMSFGTAVVWNSADTSATFTVYDPVVQKVVVATKISSNGIYGIGTVSGTGITFESNVVFDAASPSQTNIVYDSTNKRMVTCFIDNTSNIGRARVLLVGGDTTNLTAENYIGMSGGDVTVTSQTEQKGSAVVFNAASTSKPHLCFDTSSNKTVIGFCDGGDSEKGTAIVGTVSGTSISFGSKTVYEAAGTDFPSMVFDSSNNKVIVAYQDEGNSDYGTAAVGTVSGTSISFGTPVVFESAAVQHVSIAFDSNSNKVVISFSDHGNSEHGTAIVGTVSGTSISFGSAAVFQSAQTARVNSTFDSSNNKVVIAYRTSTGQAVVGTVSGTSISFGTPVEFKDELTDELDIVFDSNANKVVIAYMNGASNAGLAKVGTVSGTSISFGAEATFNSSGASGSISPVFDSSINKVVLVYQNNGNSRYGTYVVGTISGTGITFDTPIAIIEANVGSSIGATFDSSNNKVVVAYSDGGNSSHGTSLVLLPGFTDITRGQVASGSSASVDIIGTVNEQQTGLTAGQQYFVQTDGTIALTADDPSVFAGTAISATKLLVKT